MHHDEKLLLSLLVVGYYSALLRVDFRKKSLIRGYLLGSKDPRRSIGPNKTLFEHEWHLRAFSTLARPAFYHFAVLASGCIELCDWYCINLALLRYLSPCLV